MTIPLFDFAGAHPWVFCFSIWPVMLFLISAAWFFATCAELSINFVLSLGNLMGNTLVLLFRGYAPQSAEAAAQVETDAKTDEGAHE